MSVVMNVQKVWRLIWAHPRSLFWNQNWFISSFFFCELCKLIIGKRKKWKHLPTFVILIILYWVYFFYFFVQVNHVFLTSNGQILGTQFMSGMILLFMSLIRFTSLFGCNLQVNPHCIAFDSNPIWKVQMPEKVNLLISQFQLKSCKPHNIFFIFYKNISLFGFDLFKFKLDQIYILIFNSKSHPTCWRPYPIPRIKSLNWTRSSRKSGCHLKW